MENVKWLKKIWIVTLITAFLGPLLSFEMIPNLFGFRFLFITHFCLFIAVIIYRIYQKGEINWDFGVGPYFSFFAIWLVWAVVSLLWAPSVFYGFKHVCFLLSGSMLVFFIVFYFTSYFDLNVLWITVISVLVFEIALGLWELQSGVHIYGSFPNYYFRGDGLPFNGTFGHSNNFATYLSMYLPLLYVWIKFQKNILAKISGFAVLLLGIHLIVFSTSRANMIALAAGLIVSYILLLVDWRIGFKKKVILMIGLFLGGGVLIFLPPVSGFLLQESRQFTQEVMSLFLNWNQDGSINIRMLLITKGLEMLKGSYGLGVGPGNAEYLMLQFVDQTYGNFKMHNWWVEVLVDYGVIIWGLYLSFFLKMLWDLFTVFRKTSDLILKLWAEGLLISLVTFSIGVMSNGSMISSPHMWVMYGLVVCVIGIFRRNNSLGKVDR